MIPFGLNVLQRLYVGMANYPTRTSGYQTIYLVTVALPYQQVLTWMLLYVGKAYPSSLINVLLEPGHIKKNPVWEVWLSQTGISFLLLL